MRVRDGGSWCWITHWSNSSHDPPGPALLTRSSLFFPRGQSVYIEEYPNTQTSKSTSSEQNTSRKLPLDHWSLPQIAYWPWSLREPSDGCRQFYQDFQSTWQVGWCHEAYFTCVGKIFLVDSTWAINRFHQRPPSQTYILLHCRFPMIKQDLELLPQSLKI